MKQIGRLKLNQLTKVELKKKEMFDLLGSGDPGCCQCGCGGPSNTTDNMNANMGSGYTSSNNGGGEGSHCTCVGCNQMSIYY